MAIVLAIFAVATCAWAAVFVQRGSLWIALAGFVAVGYVVGPPGFSPKIGPITLTADRILLLGLGATYLWNWRRGKLVVGAITEFDWLLLGLLTYLTFRCVTTDSPPEAGGSLAGPWWRLVASFWMPAMLYLVARTTPLDERGWKQLLAGLAALGLFLALTSWAEIGKQWWAVFPQNG